MDEASQSAPEEGEPEKGGAPAKPKTEGSAVLVALGLLGALVTFPLLLTLLAGPGGGKPLPDGNSENSENSDEASTPSSEPSGPTSGSGRVQTELASGPRWRHPLGSGRAVVTSCFGMRSLHGKTRAHGGLDLRGGKHTFVRSMAPGVVKRSGVDPDGWGKYVEVSHGGGWTTLYAHLSGKEVRTGQHVQAAEVVGYVGNTGNSFGDHLHLEVKRYGKRYDPLGALGCSELAKGVRMKTFCPPKPPLCPIGVPGLGPKS